MFGKLRVGIMFFLVAKRREPFASAIELMPPGERKFIAEPFAGRFFFARVVKFGEVTRQKNMETFGHVIMKIEFISPFERLGKVGNRRVGGIFHLHRESL